MTTSPQQVARDIVRLVGGGGNVETAAHCVTRLRLTLKDTTLAQTEEIRQLPMVKGAFLTAGVYQVVIGAGVEAVYEAFIEEAGVKRSTVAETKESGSTKLNPLQRLVKVFSDVFMPILPAIITAGLLMGLNNLIGAKGLFIADQTLMEAYPGLEGIWQLVNMMANTSFVFLPALVGWSATKRFGGSEILGIVLGLMLVHPDLLNAWGYGQSALEGKIPYFNVFGWEIEKVGYQGQILPVLAASFILSKVELFLRQRVPAAIQLLIVPIASLTFTGFIALGIVGPLTRHLGDFITSGLVSTFEAAPFIGALLFGALYAPLVITGMHHMFIAVDLQLIGTNGGTFIWPMIALSNIAQGSAALAMMWLAKTADDKSMASTSALSAYFGITEPAMFGVNLRLKYPFYAALCGSAAAAIFVSLNKVLAPAIGVGGLPAFISIVPSSIVTFVIGMVIAIAVTLTLTFVFHKAAQHREVKQSKRLAS